MDMVNTKVQYNTNIIVFDLYLVNGFFTLY
jgi:hypothetical protein